MGFQFGGVQASVTISGAVSTTTTPSTLPSGATQIIKTYAKSSSTANAWYTIYTTTAGKTLYVTDIISSASTSTWIRAGENCSGNTFTTATTYTNNMLANHSTASSVVSHFSIPLTCAASTAFNFSSLDSSNISCTIIGYEV